VKKTPGGREAFVGVGLRSVHFAHLLGRPRLSVKWFEALTENYMDSEGRPLEVLLKIRADFPVALHGVSLSIGGVEGPRPGYLERLKKLADRVSPFLITDHLCFTGAHASNTHDLLPLPYTEEAIATVARNVARAQDVLGRQIALENVSSYLSYRESVMTEEEFLVAVARRAGCKILLDVNNAYVSAMNHKFAPEKYIDAVPADLVAQIHLGGYSDMGNVPFRHALARAHGPGLGAVPPRDRPPAGGHPRAGRVGRGRSRVGGPGSAGGEGREDRGGRA
jgi:uncharacterized protein (UPF0276 family)